MGDSVQSIPWWLCLILLLGAFLGGMEVGRGRYGGGAFLFQACQVGVGESADRGDGEHCGKRQTLLCNADGEQTGQGGWDRMATATGQPQVFPTPISCVLIGQAGQTCWRWSNMEWETCGV